MDLGLWGHIATEKLWNWWIPASLIVTVLLIVSYTNSFCLYLHFVHKCWSIIFLTKLLLHWHRFRNSLYFMGQWNQGKCTHIWLVLTMTHCLQEALIYHTDFQIDGYEPRECKLKFLPHPIDHGTLKLWEIVCAFPHKNNVKKTMIK